MTRTWSFMAAGEDRQYGGNRGYVDEPTQIYRYDSDVANHKQVATGDLIFVRDKKRVLGVARIAGIDETSTQKVRQRCPRCGTTGIKRRQTKRPPWRCNKKHEFDQPRLETATVTAYYANYGDSFVPLPQDVLSVRQLKAAAFTKSDQQSIEELDLSRLTPRLEANPGTHALVAQFLQAKRLAPDDADDDSDDGAPTASEADERERVLRAIRLRRGQRKFRQKLLNRYGTTCMVSGCALLDIVEAAHIWPYRGEKDNDPTNGVLLRADLHTLFDLNLMAVEPQTLEVRFHPLALAEGYSHLNGRRLILRNNKRPAEKLLWDRWRVFLELQAVEPKRKPRVIQTPIPRVGKPSLVAEQAD